MDTGSADPAPSEPPTVVDAAPQTVEGTEELAERLLGTERRRTKSAGLAVVFVGSAIATYFVTFAPQRTVMVWIGSAYFAGLTLLTAVFWFLNRRGRYGDRASAAIGFYATTGVVLTCMWMGPTTMATAPLPIFVFYYGLADSRLRRWAPFVTASLGYAGVIAAMAIGLVPETGFLAPEERYRIPMRGYLFEAFFVELLVAISFLLARLSRRSTLQAIGALERARVRIAQQNALLQEARANFERVVSGARRGRLSGRTVDGFALGEILGRGAMGEVYEAVDPDGAEAAVKVMHPPRAEDEALVERFLREAKVTGELASTRVPEVRGSGRAPDGSPYLAMERLHGEDLAAMLRERGSLPIEEVTRLVVQVAEGLERAHEASVVHRDVKPQNLFLSEERGWVILDFGVSRVLEPGNTLTMGGVLGTPSYMAPEQVLSSRVDQRADVFALGAVIYRALTGRPAFSAATPALTMFVVHSRQPMRPRDLVELPAQAELVLALALAKDPADRFASARELSEAWQAGLDDALAPELVARAQALLRRQPWGARVGEWSSKEAS